MSHFDRPECNEQTDVEHFGLHDPEDGGPAVLVFDSGSDQNCIVENPAHHLCRFVAIDHCIEFHDQDGQLKRTCDAAIEYDGNLVLIELKHKRGQFIQTGVDQLRATIDLWQQEYPTVSYRVRRAVLANSKHPQFKYSHKSRMQQFFHETGFRLLIVGRITLK